VSNQLELLIAKDRIIDTLNRLFIATDERDWAGVEACFADQVVLDMTSLVGGEPLNLTPSEITAAWNENLRPIEAIHHQVGNYRVEPLGDEADVSCYGIATHYRKTVSGNNTRTFVGTYDFHLRRDGDQWRVALFRFNLKYLDGNLKLESD
jgi:3-phenylpropionate/cinnamic acid dioxygenase small subunit